MGNAEPDRRVDVVALQVGGRDPCHLGGLPGARQLAADRPGVHRLIFERRIPYTKLGRHVRIAARDLDTFVRAGRIEAESTPLPTRRGA